MAININESTRVLAWLSTEDPQTGDWLPVVDAAAKVCTVYRPNGTILSAGGNDDVEYVGVSEDGDEGIYAYVCVPDVGGIHVAVFSAEDEAGNEINERLRFYVHG